MPACIGPNPVNFSQIAIVLGDLLLTGRRLLIVARSIAGLMASGSGAPRNEPTKAAHRWIEQADAALIHAGGFTCVISGFSSTTEGETPGLGQPRNKAAGPSLPTASADSGVLVEPMLLSLQNQHQMLLARIEGIFDEIDADAPDPAVLSRLFGRDMATQTEAMTILAARTCGEGDDVLLGVASSSESAVGGGLRGIAARELLFRTRGEKHVAGDAVPALGHRPLGRKVSFADSPDPFLNLERFGGYQDAPERGLIALLVAKALEAVWTADVPSARDAGNLLVVATEQVMLDRVQWDLGWLIALSEDPPAGLFTARTVPMMAGWVFAGRVPLTWLTTRLAHLRGMKTLQTKRSEFARASQFDRHPWPSGLAPPPLNDIAAEKKHLKAEAKLRAKRDKAAGSGRWES